MVACISKVAVSEEWLRRFAEEVRHEERMDFLSPKRRDRCGIGMPAKLLLSGGFRSWNSTTSVLSLS